MKLILTPGQVNDITQAPELLRGLQPTHVLAKGYDSRAFVAQIEALGAQAVIPPRKCQQHAPSMPSYTVHAMPSSVASGGSSNSAASPLATIARIATSWLSSALPALCSG
jgi:hypothetical protein